MAGFGRRKIKYMQALCIHNIYIKCYSVGLYNAKYYGGRGRWPKNENEDIRGKNKEGERKQGRKKQDLKRTKIFT